MSAVNTLKKKNFQLMDQYPQIKAEQKNRDVKKIEINGNELLLLIGLVDITQQIGSPYLTSISFLSNKCGIKASKITKHLQSLHKKSVITAKKRIYDQCKALSFYKIELVDCSTTFPDEPISVRHSLSTFIKKTMEECNYVH